MALKFLFQGDEPVQVRRVSILLNTDSADNEDMAKRCRFRRSSSARWS